MAPADCQNIQESNGVPCAALLTASTLILGWKNCPWSKAHIFFQKSPSVRQHPAPSACGDVNPDSLSALQVFLGAFSSLSGGTTAALCSRAAESWWSLSSGEHSSLHNGSSDPGAFAGRRASHAGWLRSWGYERERHGDFVCTPFYACLYSCQEGNCFLCIRLSVGKSLASVQICSPVKSKLFSIKPV